jgi:hypothetical protein
MIYSIHHTKLVSTWNGYYYYYYYYYEYDGLVYVITDHSHCMCSHERATSQSSRVECG